SAAQLRYLEAHEAFLVPLDRERTWFRFHRMFREMLLTKLRTEEPAVFADLNERAAGWYERAGDLAAATQHLLDAADVPRVATIVGKATPELCARGDVRGVQPALEALREPEILAVHGATAIAGSFAHALLGHAYEADLWARAFDRQAVGDGPAPREPVEAWGLVLRALLCRDGIDRMRKD